MTADERPPIAVGHVSLRVADVAASVEFFATLGLRTIMQREGMAILELRGGTHLLLFRAKGKPRSGPLRSFDFMVDDVDTIRQDLIRSGLEPTSLAEDELGGHRYFQLSDPDGHILTVYSSHVEGRVV